MHWVLQNNIFNEEAYDNLLEVLTRFDISFSEHRVVPFVNTLIPLSGVDLFDMEDFADPTLVKLKGPIICIGSYSMRHSAKKYNWKPGVFDLEEVGNFQECMEHWGKYMLNADSIITQFKDASWGGGIDSLDQLMTQKFLQARCILLKNFKSGKQKYVC